MTQTPKAARTERAAPGRRLIAAGIISRITQAGVTGTIRKGARR